MNKDGVNRLDLLGSAVLQYEQERDARPEEVVEHDVVFFVWWWDGFFCLVGWCGYLIGVVLFG
jgi:hypothetical protein